MLVLLVHDEYKYIFIEAISQHRRIWASAFAFL